MAEEREQPTTQRTRKKAAKKRKVASAASGASAGNAAPRRASKKAIPHTPTAAQPAAKATPTRRRVSPEERYRMIQEAAYYRAEREGFNGDPWKCWLVAEAEIDAQLNAQS